MVERKIELKRRYRRKKKMGKLKVKLTQAKEQRQKELIIEKIQMISPWWQPPETEE